MKRALFIALAAFTMSCGQQASTTGAQKEYTYFGEKISADSARSVDELAALMGNQTEMNIKLTGTVDAVCQKKGCWMDLKKADGTPLRVTFKDYGFFMPKDCAGKTVIVEGMAKVEETSVADLREYAKDAGKGKEEIDAIKEPKKELVYEARGVILQ
jgi:hypothetical protein